MAGFQTFSFHSCLLLPVIGSLLEGSMYSPRGSAREMGDATCGNPFRIRNAEIGVKVRGHAAPVLEHGPWPVCPRQSPRAALLAAPGIAQQLARARPGHRGDAAWQPEPVYPGPCATTVVVERQYQGLNLSPFIHRQALFQGHGHFHLSWSQPAWAAMSSKVGRIISDKWRQCNLYLGRGGTDGPGQPRGHLRRLTQ